MNLLGYDIWVITQIMAVTPIHLTMKVISPIMTVPLPKIPLDTVKLPAPIYEPINKTKQTRVNTQYYSKLIEGDRAMATFEYLKDNMAWIDGVRSRNGFTRKARPMVLGEDEVLDKIIVDTISALGMSDVGVHGIYLNYYRNGEDYTPNHSHPGMKQVVISLGATRTLTISNKSYPLNNGDVIIFGSSIHGVPKDPTCTDARISIALFLQKE